MKVGTLTVIIIGALIFLVLCLGFLYLINMEKKEVNEDKGGVNQSEEVGLVGIDIQNKELACMELGCPEGSLYVGSVNSDKYYTCDCQYASRIKPENLNCFFSDSEAVEMGYIKIDC